MNRKLNIGKIFNRSLIFILTYLLFFSFTPALPTAYASSFTQAYLMLDNQNASSALSGTVCAQPSSPTAGTEAQILITFPSDFTISANSSDWTTNTTNLPPGSLAWPGIGSTASNVSSQTVTFSSSDLTAASLYCFNFQAASSTTSPTQGNNKTGTIQTEDSLNSVIDSTEYAVSVTGNNQISVTATIDPSVSNLPLSLASTTQGTQFPQNTVISYQITYGLTTTVAFPLTIQAQWSQGTISGSPTPSVDILNYVVGSATNAYGNTAPVIDTVNRTITWTISSMPANTTNQTVNFSLETTSNYTGSNTVSFTVSAQATSDTTVTPQQTVTQNYLYSSTAPTATPTNAPSSATTISPTPVPLQSLSITGVSIQSISQSQAQILVTTDNNATLTLYYGASPSNLTQKIISLSPQTSSLITVPNLIPDTNYYFRILAKDENGNTITSDIFTFRTAVVSNVPTINPQTLVAISNNIVLLAPLAKVTVGLVNENVIVIPVSTVFEIHFSLKQNAIVKIIQAIVENKNVLGANTYSSNDANSNYVDLVETQPGVYEGKLLSNSDPGNYELYVKIIDYNGNISLQKIADIKVVNKFMVLEKGTKNPIENARVLFYIYNPTTRIYEIISPQALSIENPSFSFPNGEVNVVLPKGKYKADVSALSYGPETTEFTINDYSKGYPTVYLNPQPFNIVNLIEYYGNILLDGVNASAAYIQAHASSSRLFNFITMFSLLIFVLTTFVSFSARTHVPLLYIPVFFVHKIKLIFGKNNRYFIYGKVVDGKTQYPISKANVYISDTRENKVISSLKTNKLGEFYFDKAYAGPYKISVLKEGIIPNQSFDYKKSPVTLPVNIGITGVKRPLWDVVIVLMEDFIGILLEYMIISSVIVEFFFIYTFGVLRILPFLLISTVNIVLLLLFFYKPRSLEY